MKRDNSYLIGNKFAVGQKPNKTCFKKGSQAWNKGIKGLHLSPTTEFKKGQRGINWVPVGSIKKRTNWHSKHVTSRKWIKISEPNIWVLLAIYNWTKKNGIIPKGILVHHKDFDCLNDKLSNLKLVTRTEHINIHRDMLEAFRKNIRPDSCRQF